MKKLLVKICIVAFSILCITCFISNNQRNLPTLADSGFDSDYGSHDDSYSYDSPGGGYSSSWDDDDYSGGGLFTISDGFVFAVGFVCATLAIIFAIRYKLTGKTTIHIRPKNINKLLADKVNLRLGEGRNEKLIKETYKNYVKIQKAWMNRDLAPIKHLLTDEMYNMYQMQLDTLIEDNQINVMSHFKFICGKTTSITSLKGIEKIEIILVVKCKDYIIDASNKTVINGSKHSKLMYIYELTFLRDRNQEKMTRCPTCGAQVKKQMSATCSYCHNPLLLTSPELTLSNKKIKYQFKNM